MDFVDADFSPRTGPGSASASRPAASPQDQRGREEVYAHTLQNNSGKFQVLFRISSGWLAKLGVLSEGSAKVATTELSPCCVGFDSRWVHHQQETAKSPFQFWRGF